MAVARAWQNGWIVHILRERTTCEEVEPSSWAALVHSSHSQWCWDDSSSLQNGPGPFARFWHLLTRSHCGIILCKVTAEIIHSWHVCSRCELPPPCPPLLTLAGGQPLPMPGGVPGAEAQQKVPRNSAPEVAFECGGSQEFGGNDGSLGKLYGGDVGRALKEG